MSPERGGWSAPFGEPAPDEELDLTPTHGVEDGLCRWWRWWRQARPGGRRPQIGLFVGMGPTPGPSLVAGEELDIDVVAEFSADPAGERLSFLDPRPQPGLARARGVARSCSDPPLALLTPRLQGIIELR